MSRAKLTIPVFLLIVLTILITLFATYGQVHNFAFLGLDDKSFITDNPHVRNGITWEGIKWAFGADLVFQSDHADYWQPMTFLSRMLDINLYDMNAGGHHLTNLILHFFNVVCVFFILHQATGTIGRSLAVALLFGVHPLNVEVIGWITARKDTLSVFWGLWSVLSYLYWQQSHKKAWFVSSIFCFICSLLSKPMMITLPAILVLIEFVQDMQTVNHTHIEEIKKARYLYKGLIQSLVAKWPFWVICLLYSQIPFISNSDTYNNLNLAAMLERSFSAGIFYIQNIIFPVGITIYNHQPPHAVALWQTILSAIIIVGVSIALFHHKIRSYPIIFFGWFWFIIGSIPIIGIPELADRYVYFQKIGILIIAIWLFTGFFKQLVKNHKIQQASLLIILVGYLSFYIYQAWQILPYWKNNITLMNELLKQDDTNAVAHNILGVALLKENKQKEAINHFEQSIKFAPTDGRAYNNLGMLSYANKNYDSAINYMKQGLAVDPNNAEILGNLGSIYVERRKYAEAIESYNKAIKLRPDKIIVLNNLAYAYWQTGNFPEVINTYKKILAYQPKNPAVLNKIGLACMMTNQPAEAKKYFEKALTLNPDNQEAKNYLKLISVSNPITPQAK